jgi:ribosomal protein S18 acetylase RimI-like enzyme
MPAEPDPRIGPVGPEHAGELLTVQYAAYVTVAQDYSTPFLPPLRETLAEARAALAAPEVVARAAWLGPRLVGSVRGRCTGERMQVMRLAVAPDQRRRGLARRLLTALEDAAPAAVRELVLDTGARSTGPLALYHDLGYAVVGEAMDSAGVALALLAKPRLTAGA